MARCCFSNARLVCHLSESDALARKDAVWSCISHTLPATTPGREQHLSTLQATQSIESTLDAVLSPPKRARSPYSTPWIKLAQKLWWMGAMGRNGPIACFKCPILAPSASLLYRSQTERSEAMCFTRGAFCSTWTFTTPVPSAEHH
ncbi:hypothetical protein TNCV_4851721 [Trichonephila clavipes]|nr:hypothetical protein TNCV_4851721 [Trichonephila clavipes]